MKVRLAVNAISSAVTPTGTVYNPRRHRGEQLLASAT